MQASSSSLFAVFGHDSNFHFFPCASETDERLNGAGQAEKTIRPENETNCDFNLDGRRRGLRESCDEFGIHPSETFPSLSCSTDASPASASHNNVRQGVMFSSFYYAIMSFSEYN